MDNDLEQNMIYRAATAFRRAGVSVDAFAFCLSYWLGLSFRVSSHVASNAYRRAAETQRTPAEGA